MRTSRRGCSAGPVWLGIVLCLAATLAGKCHAQDTSEPDKTPPQKGRRAAVPDEVAADPLRLVASQEFREWSHADGQRKAKMKLLAANQRHAKFQKSTNRIYWVALNDLSPLDQEFILQRIAPDPAATASSAVTPRGSSESTATRHVSGYRGPADDLSNKLKQAKVPPIDLPELPNVSGLNSFVASISAEKPIPANMVYIRISRGFLSRDLPKQVSQDGKVVDNVLGSTVNGTSHTTSRPELILVPNSERGVAEMRLTGAVDFQTTSQYGPMQFVSRGTTQFQSVKPILFEGGKFRLEPARTTGKTHMTTTPVAANVGLGRGLAMRIGAEGAEANRPQAEAIATERTVQQVSRGLDAAMETDVAALAKTIADQVKMLVGTEQLPLDRLHCSTTQDFLQIVLLGPGEDKRVEPPAVEPGQPHVEIHVHSAPVLKTLTDPSFREILQTMKDRVVQIAGTKVPLADAPSSSVASERPYAIRCSPGSSWLTVVWNADGRNN